MAKASPSRHQLYKHSLSAPSGILPAPSLPIVEYSDTAANMALAVIQPREICAREPRARAWKRQLDELPDELLLRILYFLDVPEVLATSRVGRNLATPRGRLSRRRVPSSGQARENVWNA